MTRRNDQVFQLSLTEIAFTLIFILLLLLGYVVVKAQNERNQAIEELAKAKDAKDTVETFKQVKKELVEALAGAGAGAVSLDDTITRLSEAQKLREERDRLKQRIQDLEAQLTALMEVQKVIQSAAKDAKKDAALNEVTAALQLQQEIREQLESSEGQGADGSPLDRKANNERLAKKVREAVSTAQLLRASLQKQLDQVIEPGQEAKAIDALVAAARAHRDQAKSGADLVATRKENADLRGQVAFFKRRLEARGGRDYPPCWASESGSPEYLFLVELTPTGVLVKPSWPSHREADAKALPGLDAALQSPVPLDAFVRNVQGIFGASKAADPQCRHYVYLKSTIAGAAESDRARLTVENYFYKNELRR